MELSRLLVYANPFHFWYCLFGLEECCRSQSFRDVCVVAQVSRGIEIRYMECGGQGGWFWWLDFGLHIWLGFGWCQWGGILLWTRVLCRRSRFRFWASDRVRRGRRGAVRPVIPNVEIIPGRPKQWSPWRWEIKTAMILWKCIRLRRSCIWVPSPQSTMNILPLISTTWLEAEWWSVGKALPQPMMWTLNGSKEWRLFSFPCKVEDSFFVL